MSLSVCLPLSLSPFLPPPPLPISLPLLHFLSGFPHRAVPVADGIPLRLVGGAVSSQGRVELFINGKWGTVCDREWDEEDARVVCAQLGYTRSCFLWRSRSPVDLVHVVRRTPRQRQNGDRTLLSPQGFFFFFLSPRSSHSSDLKIGTLVATSYRIRARIGCPDDWAR